MEVVDTIAALQVWNAGAPFDELPLINYSADIPIGPEHLVFTNVVAGGIPLNPGLNGSWANFAPDADAGSFEIGAEAYLGPGTAYNSEFLDGLDVAGAKRAAIARLEDRSGLYAHFPRTL